MRSGGGGMDITNEEMNGVFFIVQGAIILLVIVVAVLGGFRSWEEAVLCLVMLPGIWLLYSVLVMGVRFIGRRLGGRR